LHPQKKKRQVYYGISLKTLEEQIIRDMFCLPLQGTAEKQSAGKGTSAANSGTSAGIWFSLLNTRPSP